MLLLLLSVVWVECEYFGSPPLLHAMMMMMMMIMMTTTGQMRMTVVMMRVVVMQWEMIRCKCISLSRITVSSKERAISSGFQQWLPCHTAAAEILLKSCTQLYGGLSAVAPGFEFNSAGLAKTAVRGLEEVATRCAEQHPGWQCHCVPCTATQLAAP